MASTRPQYHDHRVDLDPFAAAKEVSNCHYNTDHAHNYYPTATAALRQGHNDAQWMKQFIMDTQIIKPGCCRYPKGEQYCPRLGYCVSWNYHPHKWCNYNSCNSFRGNQGFCTNNPQ